jgi:hypothetical protein
MSSKSEVSASSVFAAMYAPAYARQSFEPELSPIYLDGGNVSRKGKPDYVCHQPRTVTFIEHKFGRLNRHLSQESCHAALQAEYGHHRVESHAFLSHHFWTNGYQSGKTVCLDHAYNHSLWKVLALQSLHGWEQYIVVFKTNPKPEDARAYCEAGLVWATEATVSRLLASIDLCAHGVPYPFYLRTTKYTVIVQPGRATSPEARRAVYEATVATETATRYASTAKAAADWDAGIRPF